MKTAATLILAAFAAAVAGCHSRDQTKQASAAAAPAAAVAPVLTGPDAKDIHSYADPAMARVTHVQLDLTAHFDTRTMQGTATLDVLSTAQDPKLTLNFGRIERERQPGVAARCNVRSLH